MTSAVSRDEALRRYWMHVSTARRYLAQGRSGAAGLALSVLDIEYGRCLEFGLSAVAARCRSAVDELVPHLDGAAGTVAREMLAGHRRK